MVEISEKEFLQLALYIKNNFGIHLKQEKMALVNGRLCTVLQQEGFENFSDYYESVVSDKTGESVIELVNKITTNHTFFMREADHFEFFKGNVLPALVQSLAEKDLRIWCAACSSGEESYTLAMILDEFLAGSKPSWDTRILATDISEKVLNIAKKGIYNNDRIEPLPKHWKLSYFKRYDTENSILVDKIRNDVIYRKFNLMEPVFPFRRKFHTIFCRNVMIYFDNNTKNDLVEKLYNQLEYGGYLFIGHSESISRESSMFRYVRPSVYRKI